MMARIGSIPWPPHSLIFFSFLSMGLYKTNCVKNKSQQLAQLEAKYKEIIETVAPNFLSSV